MTQPQTLKQLKLNSSIKTTGEGSGTPLQYSCLENPMDGGAWWAASPWGRWESDTTVRLHFQFSLSCTGEGNGNPLQCSCLENPRDGGAWWLLSMGSHRVGYDWSDLAAAAACHGWLPRWCQWQRTCLPMQETWEMWVWSLGREDPLGWEDSHENPHGQKSLAVCSPRGRKESDSTEPT